MSEIRITSVDRPFDSPALARRAAEILSSAQSMGLLGNLPIRRLDLPTFRNAVDRIAEAGIGAGVQAALQAPGTRMEAAETADLLNRLAVAIEQSPVPRHEWPSLTELFGTDRLARLLGISPASVRRHASGARKTPDVVAGRLHLLATVVGDLAGAYNDFGIRRWFDRPRTALGGKAPADLLAGDWNPDSAGARRVRELARSLGASGAT
jgi:Antitoxin Xre/MbcA/ParS C-terminal toxin-binding domain